MEMMEGIKIDISLAQEFIAKCPFKEDYPDSPEKAKEDVGYDDQDSKQEKQTNDGGILGQNLLAGKAGVADGTLYPPDDFLWRQPANDSFRGRFTFLKIKEYKDVSAGDFPLTVAAHHLIPGNASLYKVKLLNYMEKDKKVKSNQGKEYTIQKHIGYDVNGSHNGVWLPGNYAIFKSRPAKSYLRKDGKTVCLSAREGTSPIEGVGWKELSNNYEEWQFDYVAGSCKAAHGQFHDSHERPYSENVRNFLLKVTFALSVHLDVCEECQKKIDKIPPPYRIKRRLYAISACLRLYVTGYPSSWKHQWFTSERWSKKYFKNGILCQDFRKKYAEAQETNRHRPFVS